MPQDTATASLITVTDATFAELVLASERPVVVDFWAEWCPPCRMIERSLAELAGRVRRPVLVAKLNTDDNPQATRTTASCPCRRCWCSVGARSSVRSSGPGPKAYLRQTLTAHAGL